MNLINSCIRNWRICHCTDTENVIKICQAIIEKFNLFTLLRLSAQLINMAITMFYKSFNYTWQFSCIIKFLMWSIMISIYVIVRITWCWHLYEENVKLCVMMKFDMLQSSLWWKSNLQSERERERGVNVCTWNQRLQYTYLVNII